MQVGRSPSGLSGGRLSNAWATCPPVGDNPSKGGLRPHAPARSVGWGKQRCAGGGARGRLAGWRGNGSPRLRSVAGLRGWPARRGLRDGPDSCGRQQLGILGKGRKPDPATPRGRRSLSGCKALFHGADQGSTDVAFRTPPAPYEKSKSLGSGGWSPRMLTQCDFCPVL